MDNLDTKTENQDIFDRIMSWKILKPLNPFYRKYKEMLLYIFFGGLTFFINMGCYALCARVFLLDPLISNIIAWIVGVLFAYITNRKWVFNSKEQETAGVASEFIKFTAGRLFTLLVEELMLWVGIDILSINDMAVKLVAQIAVIILNYVISKLVVFNKK